MSIEQAGVAIRFDRTCRQRLLVTGLDRAKFLHNVTTQDVNRLPVGQGAEAFVTSLQGKTLGFVTLHVLEEAILLRTDAGGLEYVLPHFEKYSLFDDVAWAFYDDRFPNSREWHLAGPSEGLGRVVRGLGGGETGHFWLPELSLLVIPEKVTPLAGATLIFPEAREEAVSARLRKAGGVVAWDEAAFEWLRIEAGTPVFGRDISLENLPQEIDRNERAISFQKGCYLGQETVARLDALGHVNKILRGLVLEGDQAHDPTGSSLLGEDGKPAGRVTSAAYSPSASRWVGLGIVRVAHSAPGKTLGYASDDGRSGRATVSGFPIRVDGYRQAASPRP